MTIRRLLAIAALAGCQQVIGIEDGQLRSHLVVTVTGDGGGKVVSTDGKISCPPTCEGNVPQGGKLVLRAKPNGGSSLRRWAGAASCSGTGDCELTGGADVALMAEFGDNSGGANFVFVARGAAGVQTLAGNPLGKADQKCNEAAAAVSMPGHYVAWLSIPQVNAKDRLGGARGWVRPDGLPFADRVADLVDGKIFYPPALDAAGVRLPANFTVVTGTSLDGTASSETCNGFASFTSDLLVMGGFPSGTTQLWTHYVSWQCNASTGANLYCFGTDRTKALDKPASTGRIAFLAAIGQGNGLVSLDNACTLNATGVVPGTYKAFVATPGKTAASRFTVDGRPIVRPDGVLVTAPGTSLFASGTTLLAPINVTSTGAYFGNYGVAFGAAGPDVAGTNETTCMEYADTSGATMATFGIAANTQWPAWAAGGGGFPCTSLMSLQVYCLQE